MSWSAFITVKDVNDLDAIDDGIEAFLEAFGIEAIARQIASAEHREQFIAAVTAARIMIGACGPTNDTVFTVNLTGHANEGHAPKDGYSNSTMHIAVSQRFS